MTLTKKQQFEDLIDAMMIEEVAGLDTALKAKLEGLPLEKKRLGILSILDKDRGLFVKIKDILNGNSFTKTEYIKTLVEMLREYVKVGEVEKKTLGEVMTPISLVNEMLDTLPKEVWKNPNLKWLDPCGGCGIFSSVIIERLMIGLDISEVDEERYKHIVENMLYVSELQPKNMFLHLVSFDPKDEYDLNVYCGSFLDEGFDKHMEDVWGVDKFDIIVMNPPYQMQKEGNKKSQPLWHLFVQKTIDLLIKNGFLVAVHPSGWRDVKGVFKDIQINMLSKTILTLNLNSFDIGKKTFGVQTNYDYYCLKNNTNNDKIKTEISCIFNNKETVLLKNIDFIPNTKISLVLSLVAKPDEEKVNILYSRTIYGNDKPNMSKDKTDEFNYPCVYTIKNKTELNLRFSNVINDYFIQPKIIITNGSGLEPVIDYKGEFGVMNFGFGITDEITNLEKIHKVLNDDNFVREIMGFVGLGDKFNMKILSTFRKDFWKEFINE